MYTNKDKDADIVAENIAKAYQEDADSESAQELNRKLNQGISVSNVDPKIPSTGKDEATSSSSITDSDSINAVSQLGRHITSIDFQNTRDLPSILENFSWEKVPQFALITGKNGEGKSLLLSNIYRKYHTQDELPILLVGSYWSGGGGYSSGRRDISYDITNNKEALKQKLQECIKSSNKIPDDKFLIKKALELYHEHKDTLPEREILDFCINKAVSFSVDSEKLGYPFDFLELVCKEYDTLWETIKSDAEKLSKALSLYSFYSRNVVEFKNMPYALEEFLQAIDNNDQFKDHFFKLYIEHQIGLSPVKEINSILSKYEIKYQLCPYQTDQRCLYFKHINSGAVVDANSLSSGERWIVSMLAWQYAYQGFSNTEQKLDRRFLNKVKVMLLDEPDKHLDPTSCKMFFSILKNEFVDKQGIQVIMTSHRIDTVAFSPEGSIYVIKKNEKQHAYLSPCHPLQAMFRMSSNLREITNFHIKVYVEATDDAFFYTGIYASLMRISNSARSQSLSVCEQKLLSTKYLLDFFSSNQGCSGVQFLVNHYDKSKEYRSNDYLYPREIFAPYGLIDMDRNNAKFNDISDKIYILKRYSFENYLFDPCVFCSVLDVSDLERITSKSVSYYYCSKQISNNKNYDKWKDFCKRNENSPDIQQMFKSIQAIHECQKLAQLDDVHNSLLTILEKAIKYQISNPNKSSNENPDIDNIEKIIEFAQASQRIPIDLVNDVLKEDLKTLDDYTNAIITKGNAHRKEIQDLLKTCHSALMNGSPLQEAIDTYFQFVINHCNSFQLDRAALFLHFDRLIESFNLLKPDALSLKLEIDEILKKAQKKTVNVACEETMGILEQKLKEKLENEKDKTISESLQRNLKMIHMEKDALNIEGLLRDREEMKVINGQNIITLQYPKIFKYIRGHSFDSIFLLSREDDISATLKKTIIAKLTQSQNVYIPEDLAKVFFDLSDAIRSNIRAIIKPGSPKREKHNVGNNFLAATKEDISKVQEQEDTALLIKPANQVSILKLSSEATEKLSAAEISVASILLISKRSQLLEKLDIVPFVTLSENREESLSSAIYAHQKTDITAILILVNSHKASRIQNWIYGLFFQKGNKLILFSCFDEDYTNTVAMIAKNICESVNIEIKQGVYCADNSDIYMLMKLEKTIEYLTQRFDTSNNKNIDSQDLGIFLNDNIAKDELSEIVSNQRFEYKKQLAEAQSILPKLVTLTCLYHKQNILEFLKTKSANYVSVKCTVDAISNKIYYEQREQAGEQCKKEYAKIKQEILSNSKNEYTQTDSLPQVSQLFLVAYSAKELIENYLSIKYAAKEIISPLLPQMLMDCYDNLPTIPQPIQVVATHDVTWIGVHFAANIVGLKSLHNQDYSVAKIVTLSSLNTGLYTFKHYAYQQVHKLIPNDISPVESITDFTEHCWKPTLTSAVLGGESSASTAWMFGGVGIAKVAFDSGFGAFLGGYNCYQYSWQQYCQATDKSYLEKYLPYIADVGVGIYMFKTLSHIPTPANTAMKSVVAIQKGAMLLGSIVVTDITTKAMVNLLPDNFERYFDFAVDTFVDGASNFVSNIYSVISGQTRSYTEQEDLADL